MKLFALAVLLPLGVTGACGNVGEDNGGGTGGGGGDSLARQSSYRLSCRVDTLALELPIEVSYELDRPYGLGASSELTFSAAVTFSEEASAMFIEAGIGKIDIISVQIGSWIEGAVPTALQTSLSAAPINDLDLEVDTDDNGLPGPHRLELDPIVTTSSPDVGAEWVELGLDIAQLSIVLGDFEIPTDCPSPTLVGFSARFPITPSG